jgi:hypothetical protein
MQIPYSVEGEMICYRDMTFCSFDEGCKKGGDCERALTTKVQESADKWWSGMKGQAPIMRFADKPKCFEEADVR